jgi:hypothetical protein
MNLNGSLQKWKLNIFTGLCSGDRGSLVETTNKEKGVMARNLINLVTRYCRERCRRQGQETLAFRIGLSGIYYLWTNLSCSYCHT